MNKITSLLLAFAIIGAAYCAPAIEEADGDDRILNGKKATISQHPYVVSLQYKMPSPPGTLSLSKFCGGSIISKDWILTAAHCICTPDPEGEMHVRAGTKDAFAQEGQWPRVAKIFYPSTYNKTGQEEDDIALLKLAEPLKFGAGVQPIAMAPANFKASGVGTIIGWGAINEDHSVSSNALLETPIPVSPLSDCHIFRAFSDIKHLCLGGKGGGSACGGDSGGPFIVTENNKPLLAGATSFGTVKCTNDKPVVYTSLAAYRDWIDTTMAKN